jgi:signal transduction histidine kinase
MSAPSEDVRLRQLLDVGRTLVTELELQAVLDRVLETAREITGARYAALGILNEQRTELQQFLTSGVDEQTRAAIGELPRGRGVLGVLIEHPEPLRLADVAVHPLSYGFPAGHPVMRGFLGVPITIGGQAWGNLYLAEKQGGEFDDRDEQAAIVLADWAAVAIRNARLYETNEERRRELEKAVRGLQATRDVAAAIGGEVSLEHTLALIAKRGRALVDARALVILLCDGEELVVHASAGHVSDRRGARLPIDASTSGHVLQRRVPERIGDLSARLHHSSGQLGVEDATTALRVPMLYRGAPVGVLAAFDRGEHREEFDADDEQVLGTFAASAATAVVLAQSVQSDRLRSSLAAAEAERRRWARELHDETLQSLGGLRVLLSNALRRDDAEATQEAVREAVDRIELEIENLRSIITDLRPASLDELGLRVALDTLVDRVRDRSGIEIECTLEIAGPGAPRHSGGLSEDLETTVYRLVQEALTNVVKHAGATRVSVTVGEDGAHVLLSVADDGGGFDQNTAVGGFGLAGMRERVALAGGRLNIDSGGGGTTLTARLPIGGAASPAGIATQSLPDQAAS